MKCLNFTEYNYDYQKYSIDIIYNKRQRYLSSLNVEVKRAIFPILSNIFKYIQTVINVNVFICCHFLNNNSIGDYNRNSNYYNEMHNMK